MARSCSICSRTDAGTIASLLRGGRSARSVASELGLSHRALLRHLHNHVGQPPARTALESALSSGAATNGDPLDELVTALRVRALAGNPSDTREYRLALAAQSDVRHAAPPVRDLASEPEWIELRTTILRALEPFGEARLAVADALEDV